MAPRVLNVHPRMGTPGGGAQCGTPKQQSRWAVAGFGFVLLAAPLSTQGAMAAQSTQSPAESPSSGSQVMTAVVSCASKEGGRTHCPAETSAGVALVRSTGPRECLLGKTWGYDQTSVWVAEGCGGLFALGQSPAADSAKQTPSYPIVTPSEPEWPTWGVLDATGSGFVIHRSKVAELAIGAYALVRYINQLPADQQFTDHLGNVRDVDTRNDLQFHRSMVHLRGWLLSSKARYQSSASTQGG
jgi:Protein of unknown function (DUF3011)